MGENMDIYNILYQIISVSYYHILKEFDLLASIHIIGLYSSSLILHSALTSTIITGMLWP